MKMKAKVTRIVAQISRTKDRRWLDEKLKNAHEPNLEQRIFDVLSAVPIDLDSKRIRAFAKRCAELRNEISHFGSQRHGGDYREFFQELSNKAEALSLAYHSLILHEIGIEEDVLKWWIHQSPHSFQHKRILAEGGLLDA